MTIAALVLSTCAHPFDGYRRASESKEQLLIEATSTSKANTTLTVCKSTGVQVRQALTQAESPLSRFGSLLESPALLDRVAEADLDSYLAASETLQQALAAAEADAFAAASDYSARTTYKRGDPTTTPNLDAAYGSVEDARRALSTILKLVTAS